MSATLDVSSSPYLSSGDEDAPCAWIQDRRARNAAALVLFGGLVAGSLATLLPRSRPAEPAAVRMVSLGMTTLGVPPALLRSPGSSLSGPQSRLDLVLTWPALDAVPASAAAGPRSAAPPPDTVQLTLTAADDSPAPENRVATLYGRFLQPEVTSGPGELLTRRFRANSPYAGEVLVFAPPDGRRVAARCEEAPAAASAGRETAAGPLAPQCIAEFRRHGLDIQLRFAPQLAGELDAAQVRLMSLVDSLAR